jgi:hypothetical protein
MGNSVFSFGSRRPPISHAWIVHPQVSECMMGMQDFKDDIADEVSTILASDFTIDVTKTASVPHSSDGAITFPRNRS